MKNDKVKKWLYLILIFGGFFILRNFVPSGLDQAGWDGFLVLFVAVLLWLTEAVPMAVTAVFVLFFGAWVGFEKEANILANFASTGPFFLLAAMVIGQIFTKVGLGRRISLYVLPMFGNKAKAGAAGSHDGHLRRLHVPCRHSHRAGVFRPVRTDS